jgi:SAM-dependent methyltransferase
MYQSSDQFYTGKQYLEKNPGWHEEGAAFKAELALDFIRRFSLPAGSVVEVGCGSGEILVELAKQLPGSNLTGYDIAPAAIEIAKKKAGSNLNFQLADFLDLEIPVSDLLLVMDVVEHVDDVYGFLRKLRGKARNFIFHIPLDMSCRTLLKPHTLLQQRTSVGHIHYFTEETALWMLKDVGYEVRYHRYTKPDVDIKMPDSLRQWLKKQLRKISFSLNRKLSVKLWGNYSLLIWATPVHKQS